MKLRISREELQVRKLFVATPVYGQPFGDYSHALGQLRMLMLQERLDLREFQLFGESLIPRARNRCVDEFMQSGMSHLLFIDSDIEFSPEDVLSLLALADPGSDKDVVCGIYPKKKIRWENVISAVRSNLFDEGDPGSLAAFGGDFVLNPVGVHGSYDLNSPLEIHECGTGFMMIQRRVFERFSQEHPELAYTVDGSGHRAVCYFNGEISPDDGRYLSEDYNFCRLVRNLGFKIWVAPWIKLNHIGSYKFPGDPGLVSRLAGLPAKERF